MYIFRSETFTMSANADLRNIPLGFIPRIGPRGGRMVISKIWCEASLTLTTDGSQSIETGGFAKFIKRLRVWDAEGDLVNLTGPEIRAIGFAELASGYNPDPAALAASQTGAARTLTLSLDFAPRNFARRRWDYAVPVDVLMASGGIEFETESQSAVGTGGVTYAASPSVTWYAECREEFDLEAKGRRVLKSQSSANLVDVYIPANGALIRRAFAFKYADHASGGDNLSSTTDVTIDSLNIKSIDPRVLRTQHELESVYINRADTSNPFVQTTERAIPLVMPFNGGKLTSMPQFDGSVLVRLNGNTVSQLPIVVDLITRQTERSLIAETAQARGGARKVKTAGKTKTALDAWGAMAPFMPKKY
jgi:hypothetical protein